MKTSSGWIKAGAVVLFVVLISSRFGSSPQQVSALQATLTATAAATLPPAMAQALVPCTTGVTGPCDLIATKADDIVGVWKQYFGSPRFNTPDGMAYIRYNADGTYT